MTVFWTAPTVTLISRPTFIEPAHLPVDWVGEATDGARLAEYSGRICYMSQHNPAHRSTSEYIENIQRQGHGSVLEHANYSVLSEGISRSLTHELVRHRAGFAYSQVSQRYVDESDCDFVVPVAMLGNREMQEVYVRQCRDAVVTYRALVELLVAQYQGESGTAFELRKKAREAAREVLPNGTETKIIATANVRAWRHCLTMRGALAADKQIRRWAVSVLRLLKADAPELFADMRVEEHTWLGEHIAITYAKV